MALHCVRTRIFTPSQGGSTGETTRHVASGVGKGTAGEQAGGWSHGTERPEKLDRGIELSS